MTTCKGHKEIVDGLAKLTTAVALLSQTMVSYIAMEKEKNKTRDTSIEANASGVDSNRVFAMRFAAFVGGVSFAGGCFITAVKLRWIIV